MNANVTSRSQAPAEGAPTSRVALVGNPNAGKTSLFNALTGLRAKTANYPGITVDVRQASLRLSKLTADLVDLPGVYTLDALTPEEKVTAAVLQGEFRDEPAPDAIVLVLDGTNLERNLVLASEVLDLRRPTVVALNLIDAADAAGISIDIDRLSDSLHCPIVPVSARTGAGLEQLRHTLAAVVNKRLPVVSSDHVSCTAGCTGCTFAARYDWAEQVAGRTVQTPGEYGRTTEKIDRLLTRPLIGIGAFLLVMLGIFYLIFSLASVPMMLIEDGFSWVAGVADRLIPPQASHSAIWTGSVFAQVTALFWLAYRTAGIRWSWASAPIALLVSAAVAVLPVEDFRSLLIDGVIGGVGGILVFLPQICILFFFIALLEDSGYLARAAFVMERVMRSVGLPGKAFVPMLSAHACAIPGIMAARVIDNWRDRLVTILALPLLTCSARLPVYAMVASLLFSDSAAMSALVFLGAYLLGLVAALLTAFCLKHTVLKGGTVPLVLELPPYRMPSLRTALITVVDRASLFLRKAGTVILLISVVLWALATYPKMPDNQLPPDVANQIRQLESRAADSSGEAAAALAADAEGVLAQAQLAYSWAGRTGRAVEPLFRPLGFDWKMNVGVISSFAAREVIVSTLAIIYGVGEDAAESETKLTDTLKRQTRADGTPVYSTATCLSLLVFYVLAMQCLPTQAVTRRETGSWKWALFQLAYMTLLAYVAALVTYQVAVRFG